MISVMLNRPEFQYEVHSLVRAFFPGQEVKVNCNISETDSVRSRRRARQAEQAEPEPPVFVLDISFSLQSCAGEISDTAGNDFTLTLTPGNGSALQMDGSGNGADPRETKNELKRVIYRLLASYTGRTLPWGTLTGIRPTKIARNLLDQGWKNTAIADYMRNTYFTGNEKTALAVSIANREHYLLQKLSPSCRKPQNPDEDSAAAQKAKADPELFASGYSLYVGIPFCPSICLYCSFSSSPLSVWEKRVDTYLDTLCHEIDCVSELVPYRRPDTVYIGGGTPTTLNPAQLDRLLSKLEERFELNGVLEFTVEAGRPDSITGEKLQTLKDHRVTRISINPQTMNQETLDFIGRRHTVEQTVETFHLAREMGFDNINMDLIVGLPREGREEVEHTMQELSKLGPDSITVHSLAVKRAARLRLFREEHKELTMENSSEIMNMTAGYAQRAGLYPYYLYRQKNMAGNFENVGYAREGCEGLYNILIMEEIQTILALGAGAASKLVRPGNQIQRVANVKDIKSYMERIDEMIERKRSALYDGNHADL